ncbi:helix-turn-helix domain-containing protein [Balneola sp. MJW-20]|uniref:helix-turn-helix domain-containing protein n=1 Tax=Gracilimonas aurantiaca TaxID=3234185 RepID=UPI003467176B
MEFSALSDQAILKQIGKRIRRKRLQQNITQEAMAENAGLSRITISNLEQGKSSSLRTLIQVLRVLGQLDDLEAFIPEPGVSPMEMLKNEGKKRKRASSSVTHDRVEDETEDWEAW